MVAASSSEIVTLTKAISREKKSSEFANSDASGFARYLIIGTASRAAICNTRTMIIGISFNVNS